jgi:hypothetical protein
MPIHVKSTFISKPSHASHQTRSRSIQDDRCYKLIFSIDWRCIIRRQCKRAKVSILHTDELVTGIQLPNLAGWSGNSDAQKFTLPCSASSTLLRRVIAAELSMMLVVQHIILPLVLYLLHGSRTLTSHQCWEVLTRLAVTYQTAYS